jgi:hypothetical protein
MRILLRPLVTTREPCGTQPPKGAREPDTGRAGCHAEPAGKFFAVLAVQDGEAQDFALGGGDERKQPIRGIFVLDVREQVWRGIGGLLVQRVHFDVQLAALDEAHAGGTLATLVSGPLYPLAADDVKRDAKEPGNRAPVGREPVRMCQRLDADLLEDVKGHDTHVVSGGKSKTLHIDADRIQQGFGVVL